MNDVKSSKIQYILNISLISLRCRTFDFFKNDFWKNYKYTMNEICNVRFPERHTKSIWPRIKTRIPVPVTMTFFSKLWPYIVMFRELKYWSSTVDIPRLKFCYSLILLICFVSDFDDWNFKIDRQYVSQQRMLLKNVFQSCTYDRPFYWYIKYVCAEWRGKTKVCRFLFLDPMSLKKHSPNR